jgi:hypothetical protein
MLALFAFSPVVVCYNVAEGAPIAATCFHCIDKRFICDTVLLRKLHCLYLNN